MNSDNLFGRKTPSRSRTGKGLLVGILKCECGSNMTYSSSSNWLDHKRTKKGEPYGIYRCLKRLKSGVAECGAQKGAYKAKELEEIVINTIQSYIKNMITSGILDEIKKKTVEATKNISEKLEAAKLEVDRWIKIKENSNLELMKILMGEKTAFNQKQLTELYEKAVEELEKATKAYAELENMVKCESAEEVDVLKLQDLLNNWELYFEHATTEIKRQMIRAIVSEVTLNGTEVKVEIAFDIMKYIESISLIREMELKNTEIAATKEEGDLFLQYNNNRSSNSSRRSDDCK